jgi:hypothetical protein
MSSKGSNRRRRRATLSNSRETGAGREKAKQRRVEPSRVAQSADRVAWAASTDNQCGSVDAFLNADAKCLGVTECARVCEREGRA